MSILVIVGVLFGIVLGRFFKVFVLIPASIFAIVLVAAKAASVAHPFLYTLLESVVLVGSLQTGYAAGIALGEFPAMLTLCRKALGHHAPTAPSRSIHVR